MMIGDMSISLSRKRKDKVGGTGRMHWMKNRYGPDGMVYSIEINTSNGHIIIHDEDLSSSIEDKPTEGGSSFGGQLGDGEKNYLRKFL